MGCGGWGAVDCGAGEALCLIHHEQWAVRPELPSRAGEAEDRFRDLFERCFGPLTYYFAKQGFSREDSQDLAQEAFLRAHRGLDRFREEATLRSWLFTIAKNLASNALRDRKAQKRRGREIRLGTGDPDLRFRGDEEEEGEERAIEALLPEAVEPDPLSEMLSGERAQQLRQAMESLPPRMRQCVLLHVGQGLKYREVAELLRISVGTVKSQVAQARARLVPILGEELAEPGAAGGSPPSGPASADA